MNAIIQGIIITTIVATLVGAIFIWCDYVCWKRYKKITNSTCLYWDWFWCEDTIKAMEVIQPRQFKEEVKK